MRQGTVSGSRDRELRMIATKATEGLLDRPNEFGVSRRGKRRRAVECVATMSSVAIGALLMGRPGCGFDASWALVWAGRIWQGHAVSVPAGVIVPTPHPASLVAALLARVGPVSDARVIWSIGVEARFRPPPASPTSPSAGITGGVGGQFSSGLGRDIDQSAEAHPWSRPGHVFKLADSIPADETAR